MIDTKDTIYYLFQVTKLILLKYIHACAHTHLEILYTVSDLSPSDVTAFKGEISSENLKSMIKSPINGNYYWEHSMNKIASIHESHHANIMGGPVGAFTAYFSAYHSHEYHLNKKSLCLTTVYQTDIQMTTPFIHMCDRYRTADFNIQLD